MTRIRVSVCNGCGIESIEEYPAGWENITLWNHGGPGHQDERAEMDFCQRCAETHTRELWRLVGDLKW